MRRGALVLALVAVLTLPIPATSAPPTDAWLEGYASAVIEREFHLAVRTLRASQGVISVDAAEIPPGDRARLERTLRGIPGVAGVEFVQPAPTEPAVVPVRLRPEWQTGPLPGGTLFRPLIADPRWPHFSAAYQYYFDDKQLGNVAAVTFGETFALYRGSLGSAWWEVGIQAGVFAVFDLDAESMDLVNADYLVGIPVSFRYGDLSAMFRLFHQSSHLGDEFLLRTQLERINLSYESVDLKVSYEIGDVLRLYAGGGYLFDQEPADLDPWSVQYGVEFISPWPDRRSRWRPIAAVDLQQREENGWSLDLSARAGIQIDGVLASRNMQILVEYFKGRSPNGQFYKDKIEYLGLGVHFHF